MKLILDAQTQADFRAAGHHNIVIRFLEKGCAGTKILVEPYERTEDHSPCQAFPQEDGFVFWVSPESVPLLDGGRITRVAGKFIFSSAQVKSRCGCGSSFSFEEKKIDSLHSKTKTLSRLLAQSQHIQEIRSHLKTNS